MHAKLVMSLQAAIWREHVQILMCGQELCQFAQVGKQLPGGDSRGVYVRRAESSSSVYIAAKRDSSASQGV